MSSSEYIKSLHSSVKTIKFSYPVDTGGIDSIYGDLEPWSPEDRKKFLETSRRVAERQSKRSNTP